MKILGISPRWTWNITVWIPKVRFPSRIALSLLYVSMALSKVLGPHPVFPNLCRLKHLSTERCYNHRGIWAGLVIRLTPSSIRFGSNHLSNVYDFWLTGLIDRNADILNIYPEKRFTAAKRYPVGRSVQWNEYFPIFLYGKFIALSAVDVQVLQRELHR